MGNVKTDLFYTEMPSVGVGINDLLAQEDLFFKVPPDWHIVITDIKNSTRAVQNGQHKEVNFLATGSIVAVLNIAEKMKVDVPFFFGGDGATFIVPPLIFAPVMGALSLYRVNSLTNFDLEIRTGTITVSRVYQEGYELRISKYNRSSFFSIPVVLGTGLDYAEKLIKAEDYESGEFLSEENELDLSGMQCRWDRIAPPENQQEVVSLLVVAAKGVSQSAVLRKVMLKIEEIYGDPLQRQPISIPKLRLQTTFNSLKTELLAKLGKFDWLEIIKAQLVSIYGFIYFRTLKGKRYLEKLIEMSDTLVLDGKINTVISGTVLQRQKLENLLSQMESSGEIFFGLHSSNASVMSCYVRNMDDGHIHFVDGAEGGYTQASKILKRKLIHL
ncbi:hypothetical protein TH53_07135 [Pedobacter lusitanus]|uniref:DUF3095 domain-containing protein n=1 Tax=Pedobacter lusitanus TaxID=1503925 RepID=A0A0D0GU34_9SPHI|nr:DUF3095 domain-containing protein [Pedobacter lusitanus]KIO77891.1 hypothetical protein TH53_07135 [Pedobacter lusitanus]